ERAALTLGTLTDDELANAVFMHGNERPPIQDVIAGTAFMPIVYLTAAKERIRWLSRALETARASSPNAAGAEGSHVQCCDTPSFCSSVRRCTAQDVAPVQESSSCDHQWTWADGKCADCGANVQQPTQTTGMTLVERIEHVG
ncbi:hypothetical protein, partial [Burkholderia cenocepacia]